MFLVRWISGWPLRLLHAIGGLLGWLVWLCSPTYRRRVRDERASWPGMPTTAWRGSIAAAGRMVAETPWLWLRAEDADARRRRDHGGATPRRWTPSSRSARAAARC